MIVMKMPPGCVNAGVFVGLSVNLREENEL